ncbi:hypothetical protein MX777_003753 [Salmonella enterica subsp. enterica serovar Montevideo]|nr:hypothetical protein [Salmonella enterica subsp. enterica serovar Montevideo]EBX4681024.1 hypothetical protein [Salmonella enterica subsp. enterica serovar Montevideo]EIF5585297.1 hypothetical protein [Salmonella enterica subsp. enterica serovar Montevideo]EJC1658171.1 hypothetical protein [Salmonella enterica subsp. enterica serovar Montevideo]
MSNRKSEDPVTTINKHGETIQSHPAFGLVKTSRVHTTGIRLFDSELDHQEYIEIGIYEAEMVMYREHPAPRRSPERRRPVVEFRLSQTQWAAMVSSFGVGDGVPCTISYRSLGQAERLPGITEQKSVRDKFKSQTETTTAKEIEKIKDEVARLGDLVKKGRAGKRELEDVYTSLRAATVNLPSNLSFATKLMQESMDKIVSSGKAEVEAYISGAAMRAGMIELCERQNDLDISIQKLLDKEDGR